MSVRSQIFGYAGLFLALAAPVALADESVKVTLSLYHRYGWGTAPDGHHLDSGDYARLGRAKGVLVRADGAKTGTLLFPSLGLSLEAQEVEAIPDARRCGIFTCDRVSAIKLSLKPSAISKAAHALLDREKGSIAADRLADSGRIVDGCIDARLSHRENDYCSAETLWSDQTSVVLGPDAYSSAGLFFEPHGGSAAGFSFDLADKIELSDFEQTRFKGANAGRAFSSLMLWLELGKDHFSQGREGH